jgi:hypothetical protein
MLVAGGSTNITTYFALRLTADGTAATGLTIAGIDLQYTRSGVAPSAKADATALVATDSAHADNKAIEIDATDQPGLYRVDWPDAAFVAGVREVILTVKVATAFTEHLRVEIDGEVNVVEWGGTDVVAGAIPAAAADAAGGLPISDVGGLDLDTKLANTNEITAARMGALTDWINGGRLDLLLDAIKAVTDNLPNSGALTDISASTDRLTAVRAAVLTDWINGGRLDLLLDAIPTTAMRGTDGANTTVPDAAGTAPTVIEIREEMDSNSVDLNSILTDIAALNDIAASDVLTQVNAALDTVISELGVATPTATPTLRTGLMLLYMALRNKGTQTSTTKTISNNAGVTIASAAISDDATTFTKEEFS